MKAVIIDDEQDARTALQALLKEYCKEVLVVGTAGSAIEGLKIIQQQKPDIVFLDIEMPMGSGFDLLELSKERDYKVVFTTAHQQYALKAIKNNASDYLLKPIDIDELIATITRLKTAFEKEKNAGITEQYKLKIASQKETLLIYAGEIVYISADGRYSTVHLLSEEKQVVSRNLGDFEEELGAHGFFRVHKSFLINMNHVTGMKKEDGGYAIMSNGHKIEISNRKKSAFFLMLEGKRAQ